MTPTIRLTTLMLAGAVSCVGLIVPVVLGHRTRLDAVELTYIQFACAAVGTVYGLGVELIFRLAERPGWRFSVRRQLFLAMTLIASIVALFVAIGRL